MIIRLKFLSLNPISQGFFFKVNQWAIRTPGKWPIPCILGTLSNFKYISSGSMSVNEYEKSIQDLVNFLTYVSEPAKLERYTIGFWVVLFLVLFSFVAYLLKVEYWKDVK